MPNFRARREKIRKTNVKHSFSIFYFSNLIFLKFERRVIHPLQKGQISHPGHSLPQAYSRRYDFSPLAAGRLQGEKRRQT